MNLNDYISGEIDFKSDLNSIVNRYIKEPEELALAESKIREGVNSLRSQVSHPDGLMSKIDSLLETATGVEIKRPKGDDVKFITRNDAKYITIELLDGVVDGIIAGTKNLGHALVGGLPAPIAIASAALIEASYISTMRSWNQKVDKMHDVWEKGDSVSVVGSALRYMNAGAEMFTMISSALDAAEGVATNAGIIEGDD